MKRRSRSTPRPNKRAVAFPGTPGPFTADLARDRLQQNFPGASPASTRKTASFRKQLFGAHMVKTRTGAAMDSSTSSEHPLPVHITPTLDNLIEECPRAARQQPERDPPDLQDVLTQQTEFLVGMLAELRARQGPVPLANTAEPPEDPDFDWSRLVMPPETSFQVPGNGQVQRMASSLMARVPTLVGRNQHEARFELQVKTLGQTCTKRSGSGRSDARTSTVLWQPWVGLRLPLRVLQLPPLQTSSCHRELFSHQQRLHAG